MPGYERTLLSPIDVDIGLVIQLLNLRYRPESSMHGAAMSLGLQLNRAIGLNHFMFNAHSNGDHCALMGIHDRDNETDASYIKIRSSLRVHLFS